MKDAKITIRISEQEKEQLKAMAEALDIPVSQLLRQLIRGAITPKMPEGANTIAIGKYEYKGDLI